MNNEWKELDIANLPPDILVSDYEFVFNNSVGWDYSSETRFGVIKNLMDNAFEYRYRKRAPKAPTHEEIMSKWWLMGDIWIKVISYSLDRETCYCWVESKGYVWGAFDCFIGRESADIPPEEKS